VSSRLSYFPENLNAVSEEEGERFHQDIRKMEQRYQSQWNINMMADYCCMLHGEEPQAVHKRKVLNGASRRRRRRDYYYKDF